MRFFEKMAGSTELRVGYCNATLFVKFFHQIFRVSRRSDAIFCAVDD